MQLNGDTHMIELSFGIGDCSPDNATLELVVNVAVLVLIMMVLVVVVVDVDVEEVSSQRYLH